MPRVFVSYRRDDSSGQAGRLADDLVQRFGKRRVFIDVDTIVPGEPYPPVIDRHVARCDTFLAVIGPNWATAIDERGTRRLEDPADVVRLEVTSALARGVPVIPVLVREASLPRARALPEALQPMLERQAVELRDGVFHADVARLIAVIEGGRPSLRGRIAAFARRSRRLAGRVAVVLALVVVIDAGMRDAQRRRPTTPTASYGDVLREANRGDAEAMFRVGSMLLEGVYVLKDEREAASWMARAAEQGHLGAMWMYGVLLAEGRGVPHDGKAALRWLRRAADGGVPEAIPYIGQLYEDGNDVQWSSVIYPPL